MFKLFKDSFFKTNDCIILAAPLIVFISLIGWYINYANQSIDNIQKLFFSIVTALIMISGFSAAWFYMAKKTLKLTNKVYIFDKDRAKEMFNLIIKLPNGIGKYFFSFLGVSIIIAGLYSLTFAGINYLVSKYITPIDLSTLGITYNFVSSDEIFNEIIGLTQDKLVALNCWYVLIWFSMLIYSFFGMLWVPEIIYFEKNIFKALKYSIQRIFQNIKDYILLFCFIIVLYIATCFINTLLMLNPLFYFIVLLISYYFVIYVVVLLFSYYEEFAG